MQSLLGIVHGADYLISHFLIGSIIFYSFIQSAGGAEAKMINPNWVKNVQFVILINFVITFVWMMLSVHDMAEMWDFQMLWMGMAHTSFAHLLCLKLAFLIILFITVKSISKIKYASLILASTALLLPFGNVLVSHAASAEEFGNYKMVLDWIHSLAVGIWTGGLVALYFWLDKKKDTKLTIDPQISYNIVKRFSHFAMASTVLLGISGLLLAWLNGVSLLKPWETDYGKLVISKLIVFCLALLAASINQFLHLRTWKPEFEQKFVSALKREVRLEIILTSIIFIIAGFLTRTALPSV